MCDFGIYCLNILSLKKYFLHLLHSSLNINCLLIPPLLLVVDTCISITMKGVICEKAGDGYKVVDNLEIPEPGPAQILVKSHYAAINPVYAVIPCLLNAFNLADILPLVIPS